MGKIKEIREMAVAIKRDNPDYSIDRCYVMAMNKLGVARGVYRFLFCLIPCCLIDPIVKILTFNKGE